MSANRETVSHQGRKVKAKKRRSLIILLLALAIVSLITGYGFVASGAWDKTTHTFRLWFGEEEAVEPPESDTDPLKPDDPANPGKPADKPVTPGEEPQAPGKPDQPASDAEPAAPIIYVGQVLVIPGSEGGSIAASQVIRNGTLPAGTKKIALTFDSGWLFEQTRPLLDMLDHYNVSATFFPRALWLQDHPDLGQEIVKRGHTMGSHSLTHPHMKEMTLDQIRHEMKESTRIIQSVTGVRPYLFRPPYGEYDQRVLDVLAEEGYPFTIMWTVDTLDWAAGTTMVVDGQQVLIDTDFIVNRVLSNASNQGIILMHIGGPSTVNALPRIIEGLRNMGYTFTTVDQMLPAPTASTLTHTVKSGDTLYSIAQRYGVNVQQIVQANDL
ncbi:MAG: polysaccharide deacetylase family protein [Bacillota bacterium]